MSRVDTHVEFENIAHQFLAQHSELRHKWRTFSGILDSRTDLICEPDTPNEVFATLRNYQIVIGSCSEDTDFEDFGRGLSDREVAEEAFSLFVELLKKNLLIPKDVQP